MNHILQYNNHLVVNTIPQLLIRDVAEGHTYEKVYSTGDTTYSYFQSLTVSESLTLNTIEEWNFLSNTSNGLVILSMGSDGWYVKSNDTNSSCTVEKVTVGDYTDVYKHTYTFDNVTLLPNHLYAVQSQAKAVWLPEEEKMYAYFGTKQDGSLNYAARTWKIQDWMLNNGNLINASIGYNASNIGGWSFEESTDKILRGFTMVNGTNIAEIDITE